MNLQGSFYTFPWVPAAGQPWAAWHFHLAASLGLLLPPDPTLQTCSAKGEREIAFCNWIFSQIWPKSDYIWMSALITGLFDLRIYLKMDPPPPSVHFVLSLHLECLLCIFCWALWFFCLRYNRLKLVLDAGRIFPIPLHAHLLHMPSQEMEATCKMVATSIPSGPTISTPAAPVTPLPR